jgi:5'-deoxynucleotidase YfbR-like HD superfamily hydrolase
MSNADRKGDWVQTRTGKQFWPLDVRPGDVSIQDVAGALAKMCRFAGHSTVFYSVGQHCVLGSHAIEARGGSKRQALAFLLHDASEAYVVDVPRPLKRLPAMAGYRSIEDEVQKAIGQIFGVNLDDPLVHEIDNVMLATEYRDLVVHGPEWSLAKVKPLEIPITPWTWEESEKRYLERFNELFEEGLVELEGLSFSK